MRHLARQLLIHATVTLVLLGNAAVSSAPAPFTDIVVFGDSLSDCGNAGRFTNGPVWVEGLAETIGVELRPSRIGGTNYAVGGARTRGGPTDMRAQVTAFLAGRRPLDPHALYVVFGGANDVLAVACLSEGDRFARAAAQAVGAIVRDLAAAGAMHMLVPNLPDVGRAPAVRAVGPACAADARRLTEAFNTALEREIVAAEADRSIRVRRFDVFTLADRVFADPEAAGFRDVTNPCQGGRCEGVLFWDYLHPTAVAHARLAEAARNALGLPPRE